MAGYIFIPIGRVSGPMPLWLDIMGWSILAMLLAVAIGAIIGSVFKIYREMFPKK